MANPTIPVAGAISLNRWYVLEANTGTAAAPVWTSPAGMTNVQLQMSTPNMVADTDQKGAGAQSSTKTGYTWSIDVTYKRATIVGAPTQYDPGQEFLRLSGFALGASNNQQFRISEYDLNDPNGVITPRVEAYMGTAAIGYVPDGGDMLSENTVKVTLAGQGSLAAITHPYPATAAVPVITSATPLAQPAAGGPIIEIFGSGFLGTVATSGVKFGTTNSTGWKVVNDGYIIAAVPAHTAATVALVVTNVTGPSTTGPNVVFS